MRLRGPNPAADFIGRTGECAGRRPAERRFIDPISSAAEANPSGSGSAPKWRFLLLGGHLGRHRGRGHRHCRPRRRGSRWRSLSASSGSAQTPSKAALVACRAIACIRSPGNVAAAIEHVAETGWSMKYRSRGKDERK
jgi:hypothetical protein